MGRDNDLRGREEFKREAVRLALTSGLPRKQMRSTEVAALCAG